MSDITTTNYLFAYDTTTQGLGAANTFQDASFDTNALIDGWTHTTSTASFTCNQTGLYRISYTAQCAGSGMSFVALVDGSQVAGSQSSHLLGSSNSSFRQITTKEFLANITAGQILKIQYAGVSTQGELVAGSGSGTTKPSISLSIVLIA